MMTPLARMKLRRCIWMPQTGHFIYITRVCPFPSLDSMGLVPFPRRYSSLPRCVCCRTMPEKALASTHIPEHDGHSSTVKSPTLRLTSFGLRQRGQVSFPVFTSSAAGLSGLPQLAQNLLFLGVRRRQRGHTRLSFAESIVGTAPQYWQGVWLAAREAPQFRQWATSGVYERGRGTSITKLQAQRSFWPTR